MRVNFIVIPQSLKAKAKSALPKFSKEPTSNEGKFTDNNVSDGEQLLCRSPNLTIHKCQMTKVGAQVTK